MGVLVREVKPRYVVEVGTAEVIHGFGTEPVVELVEWAFHRSFRDLSNAENYAEKLAETTEFVRVVDRSTNG